MEKRNREYKKVMKKHFAFENEFSLNMLSIHTYALCSLHYHVEI